MEGVPARGALGDQVRPGQRGQQGAGLPDGYAGQAGRRGSAEVRAGVEPEQPEHPGRGGVQLPVGPGEHGPYVGGAVAAVEGVQTTAAPQLAGEVGQREAGVRGGTGSHDAQRQGQPRAQRDDLGDRLRMIGRTGGSQMAVEQSTRLRGGQQVQHDRAGAFGGQPGELVATGHHHQAVRRAGQHWTDLLHIAGVVQHQEDSPLREDAAVQAGLRLQAGRNLLRRHAQRLQEPPHRLRRAHR